MGGPAPEHSPDAEASASAVETKPFVFTQSPLGHSQGFCEDFDLDRIRLHRRRQQREEEAELDRQRAQRARSLSQIKFVRLSEGPHTE